MLFQDNKNVLIFSILFSSFTILSNPEKSIPVNKNENEKSITGKPIKTGKATQGYFRTKTYYYDNKGKPKLLNKDFKSLTFEELDHNRNIHIEKNKSKDKDTIIRYTERMISHCKDPIRISKLRLEAADQYFDIDRFDRSAAFYTEFIKTYPGDPQIERASYRNIASKFNETLPSDKDQALTKETLKLATEFKNNDSFKNYTQEVDDIIKKCEKKLIDYELNIFNYYLDKGNIKSAQKRFENIKKESGEKNKFVIQEMEKQLQAAKDKKVYNPEYEITSNTKLFDFFVSKNDTRSNLDKNNENKNDPNKNPVKKVDYVKSL